MAKKIFDIVPPHLIEKRTSKIAHKKHKKERKKRNPLPIVISLSIAVVLIILGTYLYFKLAKVEVLVWPRTQEVTYEEKIFADASLSAIDLENKTVPAQLIQEEKELWQEFDATGSSSKEGKASGTIRVYNKYTPATPITLKTGTNFLSDSGKYFQSTTKITIPAAKTQSGKLVPGYVDVKVVAIESGEEYNISASKFSVPKLTGTSYYYTIYAESTDKMTGGFKSGIKIVTADDIENAKEQLSEKVVNDIKTSVLEGISSAGQVLLENALTEKIEESFSSVKAGSEIDKFNYKVKAKVTALVFKEEDLKAFAKEYIISQNQEKELLDKSLNLELVPITIDLEGGKINLNLKMTGSIYPLVSDNLASNLRQKTSSQISEIIYNAFSQEISQLKVNFWPFWVKKAPKDENKIKIRLNFE